jgi:hypothetical protein
VAAPDGPAKIVQNYPLDGSTWDVHPQSNHVPDHREMAGIKASWAGACYVNNFATWIQNLMRGLQIKAIKAQKPAEILNKNERIHNKLQKKWYKL